MKTKYFSQQISRQNRPSHPKQKKHDTGVVLLGAMGHRKKKMASPDMPLSRFQLLHDACLRKEAEEPGVPKSFEHDFFSFGSSKIPEGYT